MDCGRKRKRPAHLKKKRLRLCRRCWNLRTLKYKRTNPKNTLLTIARSRAKKAGLPFSLTVDDIVIPEVCPILGIPLHIREVSEARKYKPSDDAPSVDRIIPELGYVPGNVRVVSFRANRIRNNATLEEIGMLYHFLLMEEGV